MTIGFIHFDGLDELVEERALEAVTEALDALVSTAQRACEAHDVTFLGIDEALLYQPKFESLYSDTDAFRISPLVTTQSDATSLLAELFTYGDLWIRPSLASCSRSGW